MSRARHIAAYLLVVGVSILLTLQLSTSLRETEDRAQRAEAAVVYRDREIDRLRTLPAEVRVVVRDRVVKAEARPKATPKASERTTYVQPPVSVDRPDRRPADRQPPLFEAVPDRPVSGPVAQAIPPAPDPPIVHIPVDPGLEDSTPQGPINRVVCFVLSQVSDACS